MYFLYRFPGWKQSGTNGVCLGCGIILILATSSLLFKPVYKRNCQTVFKKQLESKFGETTCYSQSCVLSPSAAVGPRRLVVILTYETHYPSDDLCWHRRLQTTQLQWWNEVVIQYKKKKTNKVSLCRPVEESVQTAVACQLGTQSVIGHPAAFWKCTGITKSICVWRWEIGIGKCSLLHPPSPHHCLHETVGEQWNTCGPEWYNNNFVSPGNDVFPDLGNRRAGDRQLGRQIFTISLMP